MRLLRRWFHLAPTQPDLPDDEERPDSGADEEFGDELAKLREAPVDPNLVTDTENDLRWALDFHEFERSMLDEIDRVFAPILVAAAELQDFDEVRELVSA